MIKDHKVGVIIAIIGIIVMLIGFSFKEDTWGMVVGLIGLVPFFSGIGIITSSQTSHQSNWRN